MMELNELKTAWATLDARLEKHDRLVLLQFKEARAHRARASLRPLFWGQVVQLLFGVLLILLAVASWQEHLEDGQLLAAGLIVHLYGVLVCVVSGVTLGRIRGVDYAAPVLTIQKQLAGLAAWYARSGMAVGLPWWLLWMPVLMVLLDVELPLAMVGWSSLLGVVGLALTFWFHRWVRRGDHPQLTRWLNDSLTGKGLLRAQAVLDEVAAFERE